MLRFVLALLLLAVLTDSASACERARRGGPVARVFALERAVLRLPARIATAPFRFMNRTVTRTTFRATCTPVVVVSVAIPMYMPKK